MQTRTACNFNETLVSHLAIEQRLFDRDDLRRAKRNDFLEALQDGEHDEIASECFGDISNGTYSDAMNKIMRQVVEAVPEGKCRVDVSLAELGLEAQQIAKAWVDQQANK